MSQNPTTPPESGDDAIRSAYARKRLGVAREISDEPSTPAGQAFDRWARGETQPEQEPAPTDPVQFDAGGHIIEPDNSP